MFQVVIGAAAGFILGAAILKPSSKNPIHKIIPSKKWLEFCKKMAVFPQKEKHLSGRLGVFGMSPRRLSDLNLTNPPERRNVNGKAIWLATWKPPFSEGTFLNSLPLQYKTFRRSICRYLPTAAKVLKDIAAGNVPDAPLGDAIHPQTITPSGILGLLHVAGEQGAKSWLADPKVRQKFRHTTETFNRVNGVF
ncbi:MAG: hypothetical protein PHQ12_13595 [Chthoniobacteraceae bacterium]|nr:hypothetical protein [Chthoniobacteraceae bacterium]